MKSEGRRMTALFHKIRLEDIRLDEISLPDA